MMKQKYEVPRIEVDVFEVPDIITVSGTTVNSILNNGGTDGLGGSTGWSEF